MRICRRWELILKEVLQSLNKLLQCFKTRVPVYFPDARSSNIQSCGSRCVQTKATPVQHDWPQQHAWWRDHETRTWSSPSRAGKMWGYMYMFCFAFACISSLCYTLWEFYCVLKMYFNRQTHAKIIYAYIINPLKADHCCFHRWPSHDAKLPASPLVSVTLSSLHHWLWMWLINSAFAF